MPTIDRVITTTPVPGRLQRRAVGLVFAGSLQALLVWGLVLGLNEKPLAPQRPNLQGYVVKPEFTPRQPPPLVKFIEPTEKPLAPPDFKIASGDSQRPDAITIGSNGGGTGASLDRPAMALYETHTTPPYPPLEARLGMQGVVRLRLTISTQGVVTGATVVRSSGSEGLDEAARAWVMAHWRYRPAERGGVPVAGTADVVVRFDLKNAG